MAPMFRALLASLLVGSLAGCAGSGEDTIHVDEDTIHVDVSSHYFSFEGGFWALHGDDGENYNPREGLANDFRKEGLRLHAVLRPLPGYGSIHGLGNIVDPIALTLLPCEQATCTAPAPVVTEVWGPGAAAVTGVQMTVLYGPPGAGAASCTFGPLREDPTWLGTTCTILGTYFGIFEAEITAPGMQPYHYLVDALPRAPLAGECCPVPYVTVFDHVQMTPAP